MLVYGDQQEVATPAAVLGRLGAQLDELSALRHGIGRHAKLVGVLIEAGRLQQGIADVEGDSSPNSQRLGQFLMAAAGAVLRSRDHEFAVEDMPVLPRLTDPPAEIEMRVPEGYAFYALYPEAFGEAARRLHLVAQPRIVGIRSIGTSLAAIVACALRAEPPVTVRPSGDPFARTLQLDAATERQLLAGEAHYVIVDEGPGLSGSSFGAVADWLEARGVPRERIAFMPSHAGTLGPEANPAHRARWSEAQRAVADWGGDLFERLAEWMGPLDEPLLDVSGGTWRAHAFADDANWPAVQPMWERRKFLAMVGGERLLLKFAGLGEQGERKLAMARALHAAGFTPEPIGLVHGFLAERWCERSSDTEPTPREVGCYIGARARLFPAAPSSGASIAQLAAMIRRNVGLALGEAAAATLVAQVGDPAALEGRAVRVRTDNRLDRHEWLRVGGRLLKTDAVDHHCSHDLIGCQDMAWDVGGALIELGWEGADAEALVAATEAAAGRSVDRELLRFSEVAYCAFRLGQWAMVAPGDDAERKRAEAAAGRYRAKLLQS